MSAAGIVNTSFSSIFGQGFQKLDWILFLKKVYVPFSLLKAIEGVRVKKIMLSLFERSPLGGTDAFYRISKLICVQKLSHFEVGDFSRISYKKTDKIDILRYFTPNVSAPSIFVQMS